jgi:ferritin
MHLEFQYIFNLGIMALAGVATYLFNKNQDHERRIQKLEDIHTIKIDLLSRQIVELEAKFDVLADNINREKNQENQLTQAINLLYKELKHRDEIK